MNFHQILIQFLFLLIIKLSTQLNCGIGGKSSSLIVNGTKSNHGAWPWLVSIYRIRGNQFLCGGSLVSADIIITAAHCIQDKEDEIPRSPNDIVLKIGRYDLYQTYERDAIDAYPYEIYIHPKWKFYTHDFDSDIAIIKLTSPVVFNDVIYPVCLWKSSEQPTETSGFIVGYGKSENANVPYENIPRELKVQIRSNEDCFLKNNRLSLISSKNTLCAGSEDGLSGACNGDSGGGLYIKHNGLWYLRAIISASLIENHKCDVLSDEIYTNILKFHDWIDEKISDELPKSNNQPEPETIDVSMNNSTEIVCWIANWAIYRQNGGNFTINNLKPELCTTVIYHFAGIDNDGSVKSLDPWADLSVNYGLNGFKKLTSLKKTHPHLRVLLAVGGWSEGVEKYSKMAADGEKRKHFATQSAEFLKRYDFDGLNFSWDFPGDKSRGGSTDDKENFNLLIKEISDVYKAKNLYLSVILHTLRWVVDLAYDLEYIAQHVDAINMMTFDYSGTWSKKIGFTASLHGNDEDGATVESAIELFLDAKVPANKLILGISFYARSFITSGDGNIGDACESEGFVGIIGRNDLLGYNEICRMKKYNSWDFTFDENASQMIGRYNNDDKMNVAVYDTPRSVANKVKYAIEKKLRGIWAWSIDTDDFLGECEVDLTIYDDFGANKPQISDKRDFPLLRTMNDVLKFYNKI